MSESMADVEVVFGTPAKQKIIPVTIVVGTTVEEAIVQSGICEHFPQIDLTQHKVGIWNKTCKLTDTPRHGDRIEIYRPLVADPREIRRRRAEKAKQDGRADKVTGGRPARPQQQKGSGQ